MSVSTPKYKNLFCQTLKKQVLIRGFLLYPCLVEWRLLGHLARETLCLLQASAVDARIQEQVYNMLVFSLQADCLWTRFE